PVARSLAPGSGTRGSGTGCQSKGVQCRRAYAHRMRSFVLALTGRDRPGIVAAVTRVLLDHGLNLEDAEMAILRGHFAVMLVLAAPDDLDEAALRDDLERSRDAIPLDTVSLTEVPALAQEAAEPSHAVNV